MIKLNTLNLVVVTSVALLLSCTWAPSAQAQTGTLFVENDHVGIGTATPTVPLEIQGSAGDAKILVQETNGTRAVRTMFELVNNGSVLFRMRSTETNGSNWAFSLGSSGFGISNAFTSGIDMLVRNTGDLIIQGTLTEGSSREIKGNFAPVSKKEVLEKLTLLPISYWSYERTPKDQRHLGPVAEDFYAAFELGLDEKHISPKDLAGVALVAIQALSEKNGTLQEENLELEERVTRLERLIENLMTTAEPAASTPQAEETTPAAQPTVR